MSTPIPPPSAPRPPSRCIVGIDGFNLYYRALKGGSYLWLNFQEFFTRLRPKDNILRIHYFTALVHGQTLLDQQTYLRALDTLSPLVNDIKDNYKAKSI